MLQAKTRQPFTLAQLAGTYTMHALLTGVHDYLQTSKTPIIHRYGFPLAVIAVAAVQTSKLNQLALTVPIILLEAAITNVEFVFETFQFLLVMLTCAAAYELTLRKYSQTVAGISNEAALVEGKLKVLEAKLPCTFALRI